MVYNTKGTRAHTHRELIRKWLWEPEGSSLENISRCLGAESPYRTDGLLRTKEKVLLLFYADKK